MGQDGRRVGDPLAGRSRRIIPVVRVPLSTGHEANWLEPISGIVLVVGGPALVIYVTPTHEELFKVGDATITAATGIVICTSGR